MTQQIKTKRQELSSNAEKIGVLCAFVVERRRALKLSQEEVGELIGMSRRTYQRKEDSGEFTLVEFELVARALNFKVQIAHGFTL